MVIICLSIRYFWETGESFRTMIRVGPCEHDSLKKRSGQLHLDIRETPKFQNLAMTSAMIYHALPMFHLHFTSFYPCFYPRFYATLPWNFPRTPHGLIGNERLGINGQRQAFQCHQASLERHWRRLYPSYIICMLHKYMYMYIFILMYTISIYIYIHIHIYIYIYMYI